jgi:hypothetical protein
MRLSPPEPTYLDMRNAILAADAADFGGQLDNLIWTVFKRRGMGYFAGAVDGDDTSPAEDFSSPPAPGGATGSVTGTVIDATTGLPLAGVNVTLGGPTDPNLGTPLAATTGSDGTYEIAGVPVGTYPKIGFSKGGYIKDSDASIEVHKNTATGEDKTLTHDWAALAGGAQIISASDEGPSAPDCDSTKMFDGSQGTAYEAYNPDGSFPGNPHAGPPTVVLRLPAKIHVDQFLVDPGTGCNDGASASTRLMTIETSADGTTWQTAVDKSADANGFTDDNAHVLNPLAPTGTTGDDVQYVRIKLLAPLRVDPQCGAPPAHCSGTDFIDFSEFIVLGGPANVLPSGTLTPSPASVDAGTPVTFTAAFTDPDSAISGYDWDFDNNGTVDQTTAGPTVSHAYGTPGA